MAGLSAYLFNLNIRLLLGESRNLFGNTLLCTGVAFRIGLPILHLLILTAVHREHLTVVVHLSQAPTNTIVT